MRLAVQAGWESAHAGRITKRYWAEASSPYDGMLDGMI